MDSIDLAHDIFKLFEIICRLFKVTDTHGILADIWLRAAEHSTAEVLNRVFLAVVENGDIHLLTPTDGEIILHVIGRKAVFMDKGANHPLADQLLRCLLDLFPGDVVERVSRRDGVLGRLVFSVLLITNSVHRRQRSFLVFLSESRL